MLENNYINLIGLWNRFFGARWSKGRGQNERDDGEVEGGGAAVNKDGTKDVVSVNQLNDGMKNLLVKDLVEPVELNSMEDSMRKLVVGTTQ